MPSFPFGKLFLPLLVALLLAGCGARLNTPYQTPAVTMPEGWQQGATSQSPSADLWWRGFGDPVLDGLIDEVRRRNNDLAAAAILVRRAQLQADQAGSDRLPSLAVTGSTSLNRDLSQGSGETRSVGLAGSVGYELDLWGKLASSHDAARWEAEATEEDRASAEISLIATTASLYWQLGYLNQRLGLAEASIAYARRTLELAQVQRTAGAATTLDVLEAERSLASQEAERTTLVQQRVEARNALASLFDGPPQSLTTSEPADVASASLPEVAAGLPADLLARRPDLRAAEARLRSTLATTDASRASLYPTINLSNSLGGSSDSLARLLSNPVPRSPASWPCPSCNGGMCSAASRFPRPNTNRPPSPSARPCTPPWRRWRTACPPGSSTGCRRSS